MAKSATTTRAAIREALEEFRGLLHEPKPDMALVSTMLGTLDVDVKPHAERYVVDVMTRRGMLEQFCKSYGTQGERGVGVPAEGWFFDLSKEGYCSGVYYNGREVSGVYRVETETTVDGARAKVFVYADRTNIRVADRHVEVVEVGDE